LTPGEIELLVAQLFKMKKVNVRNLYVLTRELPHPLKDKITSELLIDLEEVLNAIAIAK